MKVESKNLPKSQLELTVTLSPDEVVPYFDAVCQEFSRQNPIKGFRPGFAPQDAVIREFGREKIESAAFNLAVKEKLGEVLAEKKINLVGEAKVGKILPQASGGLEFTAVFSVMPQIKLGDWKKIKVPLEEVKVEDEEVSRFLEDIRKSRAENIAVARPAQKCDRVEIDFSIKKDGALVENGESKQHPLVLGEGHFMAGFENELIGLKEGEAKSFSLTAPADYHNRELAGKILEFEVKMNLVQERKLPEFSDEFVKTLGRFGSVADFKNNILSGLKEEKEIKAKEKRRAQMVEELVKDIGVELPEELVELEFSKMSAELAESLARMNLTPENYLNHLNKTPEDLKRDWRPLAEKRVKVSLALREIAQKENIQVTETETEERLGEIMRAAPPLAPGQNLDLTALRGYVKNVVRNEKVFELLESYH